jgi:hypothetical protein
MFLQRYILLCTLVVTGILVCRLWAGDKKYSAWSEQRCDYKSQVRAAVPHAYDSERCDAYKPQGRTVLPHVHDTSGEGGGMDDLLVELRQAQASRV